MKKIKKIVSILLISTLLFSLVVFEPTNVLANNQGEDVIYLELDDTQFEIVEKISTDKRRVLEVRGEENEDLVDVNYETGDFTITSKDGGIEKYNIKDFESNEEPESTPLIPEVFYNSSENNQENEGTLAKPISITELPQGNEQNLSTRSRSYLGDISASLGFGKDATWSQEGPYYQSNQTIDVFRGSYWQYTKTAKKYTFSASTTIATILGVVVGFAGAGLTASALIGVLQGLNVTVVSEAIAHAIDPSMAVKQKQVGRGFYVRDKGFTIKTKNWYNYLEVAYKGNIKLEEYSTDKYAYWYNNYSNVNLSELAYEQYRYIAYLRGTEPTRQEFKWAW